VRLVVIGSNSFSGAHFVDTALKALHSVLGISRSAEPHRAFLPYTWDQGQENDYRFLQADLNQDLQVTVGAIKDFAPDVVVNFAAQSMVAQSWENPEHWYRTNVVALAELVKGLQVISSMTRYVHVTTPEVYGSTSDWITENENFSPSTPYAVSRAAGDWHLLAMHRATGFPVVFTRAANVYGPGQQLYRIVPKAALSARLGLELPLHGGGTSRRSFIHIDDVADATLSVAQHGELGQTYHISTNELISIRDLVVRTFELAGVDSAHQIAPTEDRLGKDSGYFLDSSRIREELGWAPRIELDEGLSSVITWVDANLDQLAAMPTDYIHKP
jgi:dTDP-glucose 4,6-dehydratase